VAFLDYIPQLPVMSKPSDQFLKYSHYNKHMPLNNNDRATCWNVNERPEQYTNNQEEEKEHEKPDPRTALHNNTRCRDRGYPSRCNNTTSSDNGNSYNGNSHQTCATHNNSGRRLRHNGCSIVGRCRSRPAKCS